jgi:hypothetical protein
VVVYFIRDPASRAIKVGYSTDPTKRLAQLQTATSGQLELLGSIPGGKEEEGRIHALLGFQHQRIKGEWFRETEALVAHIASLLSSPRGLLAFFLREKVIEPHLCYLTSAAVGFAVSIYWYGLNPRDLKYQVMRWDEAPGRGLAFWQWYLWERPQYFDTSAEAASTFVHSWFVWVKRGGDLN